MATINVIILYMYHLCLFLKPGITRDAFHTGTSCRRVENICENFQEDLYDNGRKEKETGTCKCDEPFSVSAGKCNATQTVHTSCILLENACSNRQGCIDTSKEECVMTCECNAVNDDSDSSRCEGIRIAINKDDSPPNCKALEYFCENGHICIDKKKMLITCDCAEGLMYSTESGKCQEKVPLECQPLKQLCENGEICIDNSQTFSYITCDCADENQCNSIYNQLDRDQGLLECKPLEQFCGKGRICRYQNQQNDNVICECESGYAYNAENGKCEDIDECAEKKPLCTTGVCNAINNGHYQCSCELDGNNLSGLPCAPPAKCINANPCGEHSICNNTKGSFECHCVTGYMYRMSPDGLICEAVSTPKPSTISDETSTTSNLEVTSDTTSDDSKVFAKSQSESGEISLSTIVVPVIVLLIGVGAGLAGGFLCRKRCLRSKKSNQTKAKCKNSYTSEVNGYHFETLQERGSAGGLYHCIDVEPNNIYSTIDIIETANVSDPSKSTDDFGKHKLNETSLVDNHDYHILEVQDLHTTISTDGVSGKIKRDWYNETGYQIPCSKDTEFQDDHNYFSIKSENTHLSTDLKNKPCKLEKGQIDVAYNQTVHPEELGSLKTNTYFILEPRESKTQETENECIGETDLKSGNKNELPAQASSVEGDSHNYFVLESEGRNLSYVSEDQSGKRNGSNDNCKENSGDNNNRRAINHDYCVLEPLGDVQSLQSKVLQIQTTPDNEYNVLTMKSNEINRLKFSELKSKDQDMEANRNSSEVSEREYSHINTPNGESQQGYKNEYSHLENMTATTSVCKFAECNDYAHLQDTIK